ncbi:MAG TPA: hypothetical protein VHA33_26010 [Candidatus Angelobacter sp.]|jgi:hypothetical protein|nr:hypothetical protein [Candidatus Angelobacter sp.]
MSTQITPAPDDPHTNIEEVQEISVEYDEATDSVKVTPQEIEKGEHGAKVCFKNPQGAKLRIQFLLPNGEETRFIADSETYLLSVGGTFHFKCFFTFPGARNEVPKYGGVIDILPRRP